jgi:hypothetical protein
MAGYVPLPAYQVPRNAMLDFSGLNAGIDAINERNQQDRLAAERKEERTYQRGRNAMADRRYAEETAYRHGRDQLQDQRYADETAYTRGRQGVVDQRAATEFSNSQEDRTQNKFTEKVKLLAPHIEKYVINEKDPALRAQRWNDVLSTPGFEGAPKQFLDPVTGPDLFMSTARGILGKDKPSNVQEYEYFQRLPSEEQKKYLTMKRADRYYNAGTEFVSPDPINPSADPKTIPINVAEKASAEAVGEARGKATAALPTVTGAGDRMLATIDAIYNDPNLDKVTGFVGGRIPKELQTEAMAETQSRLDQIQGQTFLQAYNDLRGGGAITEREGQAAQSAYNRLTTQTMGTKAYRAALKEFRDEVVKLIDIAKRKAGASNGGNVLQGRGEGGFLPKAPLDLGNGFSLEFD